MKKILWLDDFRNPKDYLNGDYDIVWVKDYEEFCHHIDNNGLPDIICFDHDLGYEKSGYDCAKYLVHYCQQNNLDIPQYDIQSSNVVGKIISEVYWKTGTEFLLINNFGIRIYT